MSKNQDELNEDFVRRISNLESERRWLLRKEGGLAAPLISAAGVIIAAVIGSSLVQVQFTVSKIESLQEAYIEEFNEVVNNFYDSDFPPQLRRFISEERALLLEENEQFSNELSSLTDDRTRLTKETSVLNDRITELENQVEEWQLAYESSQALLSELQQQIPEQD